MGREPGAKDRRTALKEITLKDGTKISSPWLRIDEAAAYCGMARSSFMRRAAQVPYGGTYSLRTYHVDVLDAWMDGKLDVLFEPDKGREPARRPGRNGEGSKKTFVLTVPATGETFVSHKVEE